MKSISDGQIRAYFLGTASVAEAESFEEDCAASARLTEQARVVEGELTDDYLRGNLTAAERHLYEVNYLTTEARRARLYVAQGLWKISGEKPKSIAVSNSFWKTVFGGQQKFQLVFGGLILLMVFGGLVFYLLTPGVDRDEVAAVEVTNPTSKIENPVVQIPETENPNAKTAPANSVVQDGNSNKNQNSPEKYQPASKAVPVPKNNGQNPAGLAVFTLLAGTLRDEGEQSVTVAPNTKKLSLQLKLPEDASRYQTYRVTLKPVEGETLYTASNLRSLNFTIPAEKLENRTYIVFLEGQNAKKEFESVTEYAFRVRR
jgi:hypothetical protein